MFIEMNMAYLVAFMLLLTCICYLYLSIVTFVGNAESKARRAYLTTGICLVLFSLLYALMTIAYNDTLRRILWAGGFASGLMFFPLWMLFLLRMTNNKIKWLEKLVKCFLPTTAIVAAVCVFSMDVALTMTRYGNQFSYRNSAAFTVAFFYSAILSIPLVMYQVRWWREAEQTRQRKLANLFVVLAALVAPIGFATDYIIPIFTEITTIPLGPVSILVAAIPTYIAMRDNKILAVNAEKERTMLMLDTSPMCIQIWNRDMTTIDCNNAAVRMYGFKSKQEYADRFIKECSPEHQPDGKRSDEKAFALVNKAFEDGYCHFGWMHVMPDEGTQIPAEVTLVRAKHGDEDVVLGYTLDLREHHRILEALKHRDAIAFSYDYSKKLSNSLSKITKSPNISAGNLKAAAEIIAQEGCIVLNVSRVSVWNLSECAKALINFSCYEKHEDEHRVEGEFDLASRAEYANLLHTERLIIANDIHESERLDDGYNPNLCAMLEAPIRIDGQLVGLVCADLDR